MRTSFAAAVVFALLSAPSLFAQNAQLGGIVSDPSGALLPGVTITSTNTATGVVTTTLTNESGAYSFPSLQPGRSYTVSASLTGFCTLNTLAMKVPAGTPGAIDIGNGVSIVNALVNPNPGEIGTLGNRSVNSFGTVFLDGNIQKTFRLTESKSLSIRVDATNILNHPQLNSPNFTVGAAGLTFGQIAGKGAATFAGPPVQRNFQGQLRFSF
jgi:hypothetical protein